MAQDWQKELKQLSKIAQQEKLAQQKIKQQSAFRQREEIDFSKAIGEVQSLKKSNRCIQQKEKPKPYPRPSLETSRGCNQYYVSNISDQDFLDSEPPTQYASGGQGKNDIKKLLSGQVRIVSTLDLHGYLQDEAQEVLNEFIEHVQSKGVAGRIIHGSGLNARGFVSKLKILVRRWLIEHPEVVAYTQPANGNDGMVLVLILGKRKNTHQSEFAEKYR